jgi:serine/threonine-protein kinase
MRLLIVDRSDLYSLGVVLFEMATGRRPHRETDAAGLVVAIANGTPRADAVDPRVPTALADVIEKSLALDIEARYQSAVEIGTALEAVDEQLKNQ